MMNAPTISNRPTIPGWIARHPMAAFLILAFSISWIAYLLSMIDMGVVNGFGVLYSLSPALAALIVSACLKPEASGMQGGKRWRLFGVIAIAVLAVMTIRRLWVTPEWLSVVGNVNSSAVYPSLLAVLVDVLGAVAVAYVLSGVWSPRQGARDLLRSLDPRVQRVRWVGWIIALGIYPLTLLLGNALSRMLGQPVTAARPGGVWYLLAPDALLIFLFNLLCAGGLEEPGWRGFLLPFLQKKRSPLLASLILAVIWGLWHLPFFWSGGWPGGVMGVVFFLLMEITPLAILFTAVFNRFEGSLPIVMVLHASINTTPLFIPMSAISSYLWIVLMIGLAIWMGVSPEELLVSADGKTLGLSTTEK